MNMEYKEIIEASKCGDIFTNDELLCKKEYHEYCKLWSPDNTTSYSKKEINEEVMKKVNKLYEDAKLCFKNGTWEVSNCLLFSDSHNKYRMKYFESKSDNISTSYMNDNTLVFTFDKDKEKYSDIMVNRIHLIKFKDSEMEDIFKKYMPNIKQDINAIDSKRYICLSKTEDVFPLSNLLALYNNQIPHCHVTWMISRLMNLVCFFEFNGFAHNGITIDGCYISPFYHSIMIYGNWWYCQNFGEKMVATTKEVFDVMPLKNKNSKISDITTDIESVKLIGRTLLGGKANINKNKDIPEPLIEWLNKGACDSAFKEFEKWDKTISLAYGKREFKKMEVSKNNIYKL